MSQGHGQSVELIADIFNLPNFLNSDWGIHRVGTFFGDLPLLQVAGYDQANQRTIYKAQGLDRNVRDDEATRWRMQLGARYHF